MFQEVAAVLGPRATANIATSALPHAPVLPVPTRRPHPLFAKLFLDSGEDEERTVHRGRHARARVMVRDGGRRRR